MKWLWAPLILGLGASTALVGGRTTPSGGPALALKRLVLYSTGVGYYERSGEVAGGSAAEIALEPGQLDDALKTAVVLSEDGVAAIEYDPPMPRAAARAEIGLAETDDGARWETLVAALRGAEVKVERAGGTVIEGRVVGTEHPDPSDSAQTDSEGSTEKRAKPKTPGPRLVLFGPAGLVRIPFEETQSIRPKDEALAGAWDRAFGASAAHPSRASLFVRGGPSGGKVTVGYTTEAPVWRTTYRLVVRDEASRIQGFALVHNATDETWRDVQVTLVSGRPQSFLFPLAVPRWARRDLVTPSDGLEVAPQLVSQEVRGQLEGSEIGDAAGVGGLGLSGVGAGGSGGGYGVGGGALGTRGSVAALPSDLLLEGPSPLEPSAVSEAGDLFTYTVMKPVTLAARKSALLPILDTRVRAERVTVVEGSGTAKSAIRIANDTKLTLEEGTVAVYADAAFAGEMRIDRIKPGEARVVAHGEDLDVEVVHGIEEVHGPARAVAKRGSAAFVGRVDRLVHALELTSRSDRSRLVLVKLGEEGHRVVEGAEEDLRSPRQPRYGRLTLAGRAHLATKIVEEHAVRAPFDPLDVAALDEILGSHELDAKSRARVERARGAAVSARTAVAERTAAEAKQRTIEQELARLRQNITAAGGSEAASTAVEALGARLIRAEEQLEAALQSAERAKVKVEEARAEALRALE